jgi:NADH-quinone oxidoreductase subunit J
MFETIVFYAFAAVLLFSALRVITARNPVHSALFLVLAFFTASAIWLLLRAEFLAITLVLVYVGAVMVLFLFVVMMLDINLDRLREGFWEYLPLGLVVGLLMAAEMVAVFAGPYFKIGGGTPRDVSASYSNTKELGRLLYTEYAYAFEIAAVVLLVAIIAAIAITLRGRKDSKRQVPADQVRRRREEGVELVKMPVDKGE